jgi:hypothetical protein
MAGSIGVDAKTHVPETPSPASPSPAAIPSTQPANVRPAMAPVAASLPDRVLWWVDAHRRTLLGALLALYLLGFNGQWRLEPDSALYMTIGRNLAEGRGYTYHGVSHHLAYPGLPWLLAGLFKLFGAGTLLPAHVALLLFGLATLALTYRLFLLHAGRPTAVMMTLLLGVCRTFYRYNFELLSDVPFLTGVMAFLVGYEAVFFRRYDRDVREGEADDRQDGRGRPRWFDWVLLVGGLLLAMVMRPTMWALLAAVVTSVFLSMFKRPVRVGRIAVGTVILVAALAAGLLFYSLDPRRSDRPDAAGDYEFAFIEALTKGSHQLSSKLKTNLVALVHPSASEAVLGIDLGHLDIGPLYLSVSALPSLFCIGAALLVFRRRLLWGVWVSVTLLMMAVTVVHVRYFLQVMPLLLYGCWLALVAIDQYIADRDTVPRSAPGFGRANLNLVFAALLALLLCFNLLRVASLIGEQRRVPFLANYRDGKYANVPQLADLLASRTPEKTWVLAPQKYGRVLTYLSGRYVTEPGPATQLNPVEQRVYVLEPMDKLGQDWLAYYGIGSGEAVGPVVPGRRGKDWQLRRAVRVPSSNVLPRADGDAGGAGGLTPP